MCKMITISLAQRADMVNLDSSCLYTNREGTNSAAALIDRELARFIYVREVKRFDPFKFSIYAWCIKIAIAGSLAPVRLAWCHF